MAKTRRVTPEKIDHPSHYNQHPTGIECIDVVEAGFSFNTSSAIKYLWRCMYNDATYEDLGKARWYIDREIARLQCEDK
jgi:hypothetical protein